MKPRWFAEYTPEMMEQQLLSVAEASFDAIVAADFDGKIMFWSLAAEKLFGLPSDQIVGKPVYSIVPERFRAAHIAGFNKAIATGKSSTAGRSIDLHGLKSNGEEFPLRFRLAMWHADDRAFFTCVIRDLSEPPGA